MGPLSDPVFDDLAAGLITGSRNTRGNEHAGALLELSPQTGQARRLAFALLGVF